MKWVFLCIHELKRAKVSISFIISFKPMLFQHFNSHTRKLNVLMSVCLHRIMIQTHVTTIGTQRTLDPTSISEAVGEPHCILDNSFFIVFSFIFSCQDDRQSCPYIHLSFRGFIDSHSNTSLSSLSFYWLMFRFEFQVWLS